MEIILGKVTLNSKPQWVCGWPPLEHGCFAIFGLDHQLFSIFSKIKIKTKKLFGNYLNYLKIQWFE